MAFYARWLPETVLIGRKKGFYTRTIIGSWRKEPPVEHFLPTIHLKTGNENTAFALSIFLSELPTTSEN